MTARADAAILALDQGTTATTAIVFGPAGEVLGRASSEFTQHYPQPGWVEHDAVEIWDTSRRVMAEALASSGLAPAALKGIGITNQRETAVVWDRASGRPVHRAVVWQSRQTADICARLKADGPRAPLPRAHRPGPRSLLLRDQGPLDPRPGRRSPVPSRGRASWPSGRSTAGSSTG